MIFASFLFIYNALMFCVQCVYYKNMFSTIINSFGFIDHKKSYKQNCVIDYKTIKLRLSLRICVQLRCVQLRPKDERSHDRKFFFFHGRVLFYMVRWGDELLNHRWSDNLIKLPLTNLILYSYYISIDLIRFWFYLNFC